MKRGPHKPLSVRITREGVMTIEIGIETLAVAALDAPYVSALADERGDAPGTVRPDEAFRISNRRGWARDVAIQLTDASEDGASLLTNALDAAVRAAIEDGSEHFVDIEDKAGRGVR